LKLLEALRTSLRAARVPGQVAAKIMLIAEEALAAHGISNDNDLFELPDWSLWIILIKSLLTPITKNLRREGFCHANAYVISAFMLLDERAASLIKEWLRAKCGSGVDPCCKNPPCCNLV